MTISMKAGEDSSDYETPLLEDVVRGSVDCNGAPSVRSKSGCWKSSAFVVGTGVAERFAYYGISTNLTSYLTGRLGISTASAASMLNAWFGIASLLPILGAFIADSFSGRYRMIIVASVLYVTGLGFLALSASLNTFDSSNCNPSANGTPCSPPQMQTMFFFFSLYLIALAQGGHTPCVQAFGADQFDDEDEKEKKAKSSFFNWWYWFSVGGILVPLLAITYIQENVSWELGFGIPAIVMCFTLVIFLSGTKTYRFRINSDARNPIVKIAVVFVKAACNWRTVPKFPCVDEEACVNLPKSICADGEPCVDLAEEARFKFLDKALLTRDGSLEDEKVCSADDVEDARSIVRLVPIWVACLGYSIIFAQPSTLFTKQASTMDRYIAPGFQIPAASLQNCYITLSIIIFVPIYDRFFVPVARAVTKRHSGITMLQRIGIGLFLSLLSIVFAAVVERKRLALAAELGLVDSPTTMIPMSILWLAPQYVLSGVSDVFAMIGLQEFFYDQVPDEFKSIGLAMFYSILGIGSLLSSFLVSTIEDFTTGPGEYGWFADNLNRAHLDYFYLLLSGISAFGFAAFLYFAKSFVYRKRVWAPLLE